jgi:cytidylate kinase
MNIPVLTIDGPSGAGKGTVSRAVAKHLGWHYLDSGAIYRSLAVAALAQQVELSDSAAVVAVARAMRLEFDCQEELQIKLNGTDITAQLPDEKTGNAASLIAAYPAVRAVLLQKQKDFKQAPGLVADGRDMGTVVFPEARYKVYLTATSKQRAERRYKQLIKKGISANLDQITQEIEARDKRDSERVIAPLVAACDARIIDSSDLMVNQVIEAVLSLVR